MKTTFNLHSFVIILACFAGIHEAPGQGTAFTYQGRLQDNGAAATGTYNLTFSLFDLDTGGAAIAGPVTNSAVLVTNGLFTVLVDFGPGVFTGTANWLEIGVETNGSGGTFIPLTPRQELTPSPFAIYAANATEALTAATATTAATANQVAVDAVTTGALQNGAVTGAKIASGQVVKSLTAGADTLYDNITLAAGNNVTITPNGQTVTIAAAAGGSGSGWSLTGNAGTTPGLNFVGTTDDQPLEFWVNDGRALRLESGIAGDGAPNVTGGSPLNLVASGVTGATIGGGGAINYEGTALTNSIAADFGAIGGGYGNAIQSSSANSVVSGGGYNTIVGSRFSTVGGGLGNAIQSSLYGGSTIGGGGDNTNSAYLSTISGGAFNLIAPNSYEATIGGGSTNTIQTASYGSTISGGTFNTIQIGAYNSTVGGGRLNTIQAYAYSSTIGGGESGIIETNSAECTISGGFENTIQTGAGSATISGGDDNIIQSGAEGSTIGGGDDNRIGGGASGAVVPGGLNNVANGNCSFAAGRGAQALHQGAFVWADYQGPVFPNFASTADNQVSFRCSGGVLFTSGSGSGNQTVQWTPGSGSWSFSSDRNLKDRFAPVNGESVLEKVCRLPVAEWSYKGCEQRHIGAMAQDFHALFPLNDNDKVLNDADLHGVELAAIQGLNQKLNEKELRLEALEKELGELKQAVKALAEKGGSH